MSIFKSIGKIISAPVRGIGHALRTSGIPIVSGLDGDAEKFGNAFAGKGGFLKNILPAVKDVGLGLATGGMANLSGLGGLGGLAGKIGHALSGPNMLGNAAGKLDLGKLIGAAGGISGMVGQGRQRKSAQNYANARTSQLNVLMSKVLARPNYG